MRDDISNGWNVGAGMMGGKSGWNRMIVVGVGVAKMREIATEGSHKLRLHRGVLSFNEELITANVQVLPLPSRSRSDSRRKEK
jgi:hypothetical protein